VNILSHTSGGRPGLPSPSTENGVFRRARFPVFRSLRYRQHGDKCQ
jgi:hypothetical protein